MHKYLHHTLLPYLLHIVELLKIMKVAIMLVPHLILILGD